MFEENANLEEKELTHNEEENTVDLDLSKWDPNDNSLSDMFKDVKIPKIRVI